MPLVTEDDEMTASPRTLPGSPATGAQEARTPWAWRLPTDAVLSSTHMLDALLGGLMMFRYLPLVPSPVPVSDLVGMLFILIMFFRHPRYRLGSAQVLVVGGMILLGYLVGVSFLNEVSWLRRSVHITVLAMTAMMVGTGRASLTSILRGACIGLVLNAALFYAGAAPDSYGGLLTGYLEDKNRAGMVIGTVGVLACGFARRRFIPLIIVLTTAGVWLTGSRTTLGGLAAAMVWLLLRPMMTGLIPRLALGGVLAGLLNLLVDEYSQEGTFADRAGSDLLRASIDEAVSEKLQHTPLYGGGLGTATVDIDGHTWFFHNAYDGLRQEGGWVFLVAVVAVVVWLGLRPGRTRVTNLTDLFVEAATVVLLVCAWKLGEVFLSITTYALLAAALRRYLASDDRTRILRDEEAVLSQYNRATRNL